MPEKYLIDGHIMNIVQCTYRKNPYWIGAYKAANGQWMQRYFGKDDPRPNYPRYSEPTGLIWLYGLGRWQRS